LHPGLRSNCKGRHLVLTSTLQWSASRRLGGRKGCGRWVRRFTPRRRCLSAPQSAWAVTIRSLGAVSHCAFAATTRACRTHEHPPSSRDIRWGVAAKAQKAPRSTVAGSRLGRSQTAPSESACDFLRNRVDVLNRRGKISVLGARDNYRIRQRSRAATRIVQLATAETLIGGILGLQSTLVPRIGSRQQRPLVRRSPGREASCEQEQLVCQWGGVSFKLCILRGVSIS
jgi:hypothetical protein